MTSNAELSAYDHGYLVDAVRDAKDWGYTWPRRWCGFYAGLNIQGHPQLTKEYRQHRVAIQNLLPKSVSIQK